MAGTLAVVASSLSYASGGVYGELRVHRAPGSVLATGSMLAGALALLPFAVADPPTHARGRRRWLRSSRSHLPTFVGQLLLFRMLRLYGSPRLSLVTYLMPGFAVVYGVVLLGEPLTAAALGARADPRRRCPRLWPTAVRHAGAGVGRVSIAIRRATGDDVDFLVELVTHDDVEPFLAAIRAKG